MSLHFTLSMAEPLHLSVRSPANPSMRVDVRLKQASTVLISSYSLSPPAAGSVVISAEPDNQLKSTPGGLFVPPSSWETVDW